METATSSSPLLPAPRGVVPRRNRPFIPFRRRGVVSPLTRGLLLAGVFAIWCGLSTIYGNNDADQTKVEGNRHWTGKGIS
jgi:hypothetical protein